MSMSFTWSSNLDLEPKGEAARAGTAKGLYLGAEHVLAESNKLVPIEDADLERSGVASVDEDSLMAAVSYDTDYAVDQHENMDYAHDSGRQAKYLETAANAEVDTVRDLIANQIRKRLGL